MTCCLLTSVHHSSDTKERWICQSGKLMGLRCIFKLNDAHYKSFLMTPAFIQLNYFRMTVACMPCHYGQCTATKNLSRNYDIIKSYIPLKIKKECIFMEYAYQCTLLNSLIFTFLLFKASLHGGCQSDLISRLNGHAFEGSSWGPSF